MEWTIEKILENQKRLELKMKEKHERAVALDPNYYEKKLPPFLQHDIDALIEGKKINSSVLDCLWCELYASINMAEVDLQITKEQAAYLRGKYL